VAGPARRARSLKTWATRAVQLTLTVLVTWFIFARIGLTLDEIRAGDGILDWQPEPLRLLASCLVLSAGYAMSAVIWSRMVRDLGGPRVAPFAAVRLFMIANLGRYVPGKVWQIAGLAALARGRGVPAGIATGSAILGQGIALVAATGIGLGALLTAPEGAYRSWGIAAAAVMGVVVILIAIPAFFRSGATLWFRVARTEPPSSLESAHGLLWLALYAVNWAVYALSFWLFVASFDPSAAVVPVASAFAAAYVLGYVAIFAPAGLGIREGALVVFLTPHLGGIGLATGVALLARLWTTLVEVAPAGAFWVHHTMTASPEPSGGGEA